MSDPSSSLYSEPPQAPKSPAPGPLDQIVGVFTAPGELFDRLHESPSWGWAVGIMTAFGVVLTVIWGLKVDVDEMIRPILERNPKIDSSQIDTIIEVQKKFILPFGILGALFGTILIVLIVALLYWLVGKVMAESQRPNFLQALSAAAVPGLVRLPYILLIILICLLRPIGGLTPDKIAPTSIGYFLHVGSLKLQALLYAMDLFFIASEVVSYLALRRITRLKAGGAILCVAVTVLLALIGPVLGAR